MIRLPWYLSLKVPQDLPRWTPDTANPLIYTPVQSIDHNLSFDPAAKLKWFHNIICQLSHHDEVPQSCMPQDPIFHFIAYLHELHPITWTWHSSEQTPNSSDNALMPDTLQDQLHDLHDALHLLEHTLAQDWKLWCEYTQQDGRRDVYRRSNFCRSPRCLRTEPRQKTDGGHLGWDAQTWQGSYASILTVLGINVEWRQRRRVVAHAGPPILETRGRLASVEPRQELHVLHSMCSRQYHAQYIDQGPRMEPTQGEGRGDHASSDDDVSSLYSGVS